MIWLKSNSIEHEQSLIQKSILNLKDPSLGYNCNIKVTAGTFHSCAYKPNTLFATNLSSGLSCWGQNLQSQSKFPYKLLYLFKTNNHSVPSVAAGGMHTCLVLKTQKISISNDKRYRKDVNAQNESNESSKMYCYGWNEYGQSKYSLKYPNPLEVYTGEFHSCALSAQQELECWGLNRYGECDIPIPNGNVKPTTTSTRIYLLASLGYFHTCSITTHNLPKCWGWDKYNQSTPPPWNVLVTSIAAGGFHSCAATDRGTVHCWGSNSDGQLDTNSILNARKVSAGERHACTLTMDDELRCWGRNQSYQSEVINLQTYQGLFIDVSAGFAHNCAVFKVKVKDEPEHGGIMHEERVKCWGYNEYKQVDVPDDIWEISTDTINYV